MGLDHFSDTTLCSTHSLSSKTGQASLYCSIWLTTCKDWLLRLFIFNVRSWRWMRKERLSLNNDNDITLLLLPLVVIPWYGHLQKAGIFYSNWAALLPTASHRLFMVSSLNFSAWPFQSWAFNCSWGRIFTSGLSQCQASAVLHDPVMPSKSIPRERLLDYQGQLPLCDTTLASSRIQESSVHFQETLSRRCHLSDANF